MKDYEISYEVFEDNGGGVHMAILKNDEFAAMVLHLEEACNHTDGYGLIDVLLDELEEDPTCWEDEWGNVYEPINDDDPDPIDVYNECVAKDNVVAWGTPVSRKECLDMGDNAKFLLGRS